MPPDSDHDRALEAQRNVYRTVIDALNVEIAAFGGEENASPDAIAKLRNAERHLYRLEREMAQGTVAASDSANDSESWILLSELWDAYRRCLEKVGDHEGRLRTVESLVMPGLKRRLATGVSVAILVVAVCAWLIKEIRDYYLVNPLLAVTASALFVCLAVLVRWLPESEEVRKR